MLRKALTSAVPSHGTLLLQRRRPLVVWMSRHEIFRTAFVGATHRVFSDRASDRLLGHNPMSQPSVSSNQVNSRIPTQEDVSVAGGIWNPTSAKRDKIAELRVELQEGQYSLDDAATPEQKLDLYLADGIQWIVHTVDQLRVKELPHCTPSVVPEKEEELKDVPDQMDPRKWKVEKSLQDVEDWIAEQEKSIQSTIKDGNLDEQQWKTYLNEVSQKLDEVLSTLPASRYLRYIRDFYVVSPNSTDGLSEVQTDIAATEDQATITSFGNKALARYRLLLTKGAVQHLRDSWSKFTTLTDEALDRLAVKTEGGSDELEGKIKSLPLVKLNAVLKSHLLGNSVDRVDALWNFMDYDDDGLLEKTEMETVANSTVVPVQSAILVLFDEALEAHPVRDMPIPDNDKKDTTAAKQGWRKRRLERKEKKRLLKHFHRAVRDHFEDEVEMPHRLRCIYTWADKSHQGNKIDSVLIEASGWSGRKRYVELQPKISLPEFREVQQIHFTHLDRIGWEIAKSFREDLWVEQGKGRQNAELKRDCLIFLTVVSAIDYAIIVL